MTDYDSHYELPGGGTVAIDYGEQDHKTREVTRNEVRQAVQVVREGAEATDD